jgi:type II secretory pathway component PulF
VAGRAPDAEHDLDHANDFVMINLFEQLLPQVGPVVGFFLMLAFYAVACLAPVAAVIYLFYFLLTLPLRRTERARVFLDLLELGLKDGRTPESAILEASASRDSALGIRLHLLAAHIEKGSSFAQALDEVPRLLPPQVRAMLKTGLRIGDVTKVLPACRQLLHDSVSQVRGALNYLIVLAFCVTPFTILVPTMLAIAVFPKYKEVFYGMGAGMPMPALTEFVLARSGVLICLQVAVLVLVWGAMAGYVGGPRLRNRLKQCMPAVVDGVELRLPWRRKRLQRDFSAMLAILLDAGVPEGVAVIFAAETTDNSLIRKRAADVRDSLAKGVRLSEAIRSLDDTGELHWRISNALQSRGGFLRALAGWHEALDARAFQLEQTAAQSATTGFVLFNGAFVALLVLAVFLMLISLLNEATLW